MVLGLDLELGLFTKLSGGCFFREGLDRGLEAVSEGAVLAREVGASYGCGETGAHLLKDLIKAPLE